MQMRAPASVRSPGFQRAQHQRVLALTGPNPSKHAKGPRTNVQVPSALPGRGDGGSLGNRILGTRPQQLDNYSAGSLSSFDQRFDVERGFGFSAGGLLFPYMLGVCSQLQEAGVISEDTPVAGASAGSIVAVCAKSGLSTSDITTALLDLAQDCRNGGTRKRLRGVLSRVLHEVLPDDIHQRCEGRSFLAVTRLWPSVEPQTVSSFTSRDDVISTVLTSCHIPYWFDGSLYTKHREGLAFDGGITQFIPKTPTLRCHQVCCFPAQQMRAFPGIELAPDTFEPWPHDMGTMLRWAFEPADDDMLLQLLEKGRKDARAWVAVNVPSKQLASS